MKKILLILVSFIFIVPMMAEAKPSKKEIEIQDSLKQVRLNNLKKEVDALLRVRLEKADYLEKKEAEHWRAKYKENLLTEEHQSESRGLEARYSKLSTDLGRITEELMATKTATSDFEEKASSEESSLEAFQMQVDLSIQKRLEEVPGDYPLNMEKRLLRLNSAKESLSKKNPNLIRSMQDYLDELLERHSWTYTQDLETRFSLIGSRPDVKVDRLRLGTIFLGEVAHDNGDVQALLKTGALQGKIYDWNTDLIPSLKTEVRTAVLTSKSQNEVFVPLDVLQNKTVKNTVSGEKELTTKEAFIAWFKKGGIVMYPLALAALFAILLCLERFIFLYRRGHLSKRFNKKFDALVEDQKYEEAASLCLKKETSLSLVLFSVVNRAMETRDAAEKSLQEALLREQPKLDKRMGLISAIGTIAPLLGLLGTVTGIITLFTVITELGTNDARVLAGGISEALITTETGLIIAIPVMILHGLLSEKVEQVTSELYIQSTSLLNKLFPEES